MHPGGGVSFSSPRMFSKHCIARARRIRRPDENGRSLYACFQASRTQLGLLNLSILHTWLACLLRLGLPSFLLRCLFHRFAAKKKKGFHGASISCFAFSSSPVHGRKIYVFLLTTFNLQMLIMETCAWNRIGRVNIDRKFAGHARTSILFSNQKMIFQSFRKILK
jgi:hypothetical protein